MERPQHLGPSKQGIDEAMTPTPMYFTYTWQTFLWFQAWQMHSRTAYVLSFALLMLLGILYEHLSAYKSAHLAQLTAAKEPEALPLVHGSTQETLADEESQRTTSKGHSRRWHLAATATALHVLHLTVGYLLMLAIMTFNAGYFVAVVLGMGVGYWCNLVKSASDS